MDNTQLDNKDSHEVSRFLNRRNKDINLKRRYLATKDYVFFCLAQFASSSISGLVQGYMLFFYTVCIGISAISVGTMFLATRILSAFIDPMVGAMVDGTHTKLGKMRPYLFFCSIPWGILVIIMFMPGLYALMNNLQRNIFMWATYITFSILGSIISVPMQGLPSVSSPNVGERTKIMSISKIVASIGEQSALVLFTLFLLVTSNNYSSSYMYMGLIIGILGPIFMMLGARFLKERVVVKNKSSNVFDGFKYLVKNKQYFVFFLSNVLTFFRNMVSSMIIYVVTYIYGNGSMQMLFALPGAIASMIGMLLAPRLRKILDSKKLFIFATLWHSIGLASVFAVYMLGGREWWIVSMLMFVAMIPVGVLNVIPQFMATDILDYWEDKTGVRREGITFSLLNLKSNIATGLKDYLLMYLLVFFGFSQVLPFLDNHMPVQSDFTAFGLFAMYTIIPAILNLISIVPMIFYRLNRKRMSIIHQSLEEKRLSNQTANELAE